VIEHKQAGDLEAEQDLEQVAQLSGDVVALPAAIEAEAA